MAGDENDTAMSIRAPLILIQELECMVDDKVNFQIEELDQLIAMYIEANHLILTGETGPFVASWCGEQITSRRLQDCPLMCYFACTLALWWSPRLGNATHEPTVEFDHRLRFELCKTIRTGVIGYIQGTLIQDVAFTLIGVGPTLKLMYSIHGMSKLFVPGYASALKNSAPKS